MENGNNHMKEENVSSTPSIFPPNSNSPPHSNTSQYPPNSGMPYPQQYPPPNSAMDYPQPYVPPPGGQPYYPQPGSSNQSPQPQQQQVFVVNDQPIGVAPLYDVGEPRLSMTGAIVLSCITFWCCGCLFGGIAFILARSAQSSAAAGDIPGAIRLRNASYGLSIAGIIIAVIVIAVVAGVLSTAVARYSRHYYYCNSYYYGTSYYYCK